MCCIRFPPEQVWIGDLIFKIMWSGLSAGTALAGLQPSGTVQVTVLHPSDGLQVLFIKGLDLGSICVWFGSSSAQFTQNSRSHNHLSLEKIHDSQTFSQRGKKGKNASAHTWFIAFRFIVKQFNQSHYWANKGLLRIFQPMQMSGQHTKKPHPRLILLSPVLWLSSHF